MFEKKVDYKECIDGYRMLKNRFLMTSFKGFEYECGRYSIIKDGCIMAQPGFWWNGASGPTFDTPNTMEASCFHDILYDMLRLDKIPNTYWNRRKSDKMFYKALRRDGMSWFRANYWYWGVRGGGWYSV